MQPFEQIAEINKPYLKMLPLAAIHLNEKAFTDKGFMRRIEEGMKVCVVNGKLTTGEFTHAITSLRGTLMSTRFEISLIDLKTQELSIIKF